MIIFRNIFDNELLWRANGHATLSHMPMLCVAYKYRYTHYANIFFIFQYVPANWVIAPTTDSILNVSIICYESSCSCKMQITFTKSTCCLFLTKIHEFIYWMGLGNIAWVNSFAWVKTWATSRPRVGTF